MPTDRDVFCIEPGVSGVPVRIEGGIILNHPPFSKTWLLLNETKGGCTEMSTKKSVSLGNGIRATHATSGNLARKVVVNKGRIEIGGRHVRRDKGRGRDGGLPM